jgi:mersacidin/lichenicidin family type 2 lantibiotic
MACGFDMAPIQRRPTWDQYINWAEAPLPERSFDMTSAEVIQNWKNEDFVAGMPSNPAGLVELNDSDLAMVDGGTTPVCIITVIVTITMLPTPAY